MSGVIDYAKKTVGFDSMVNGITDVVLAPFRMTDSALGLGVSDMLSGKKSNSTTPLASLSKMQESKNKNIRQQEGVNNISNYVKYMYSQNPSNYLGNNILGL